MSVTKIPARHGTDESEELQLEMSRYRTGTASSWYSAQREHTPLANCAVDSYLTEK